MATLITLSNKIKSAFDEYPAIKKYIFDDLNAINTDSQSEYPLLLCKPPQSVFDNNTLDYQYYNMELYVFDVENSDDWQHWTEKWDVCMDHLRNVIKKVLEDTQNYILVGNNVSIELGHFQHNDKLIGAKATFRLRMYYGC